MLRAAAALDLRPAYRNAAYSLRMPARGISVDVPTWWMDLLVALIEPADGEARARHTKTDLAVALMPPNLEGAAYARELNAARRKVTHFLTGDASREGSPVSRTIEVVEAWCQRFDLPPFQFEAASRREALAMRIVQQDPDLADRVIAARMLEMSVDSGENRLDGILSYQPPKVRSGDGVVRRGSGSRKPG